MRLDGVAWCMFQQNEEEWGKREGVVTDKTILLRVCVCLEKENKIRGGLLIGWRGVFVGLSFWGVSLAIEISDVNSRGKKARAKAERPKN